MFEAGKKAGMSVHLVAPPMVYVRSGQEHGYVSDWWEVSCPIFLTPRAPAGFFVCKANIQGNRLKVMGWTPEYTIDNLFIQVDEETKYISQQPDQS
ncbi:hypothetical protein C365_04972 [Cryptococcus neoformans Bt85]|nr:hypothetical protein C365_04972 [Cryptococcus neoformans var. grubii Bt85]